MVVHTGGTQMGLRTMLVKHPKTGVYQFRKRIPKELVAIFGRNEIKKSLSTKNPAEAKIFVLKAESDFNDLMEAQRLNLLVSQEERYKALKDLQQCGLVSLDTTDITLVLIDSLYCTVHDILAKFIGDIIDNDVMPATSLPEHYDSAKFFRNVKRETVIEVAQRLKLYQHMYKQLGFNPSEYMKAGIKGRSVLRDDAKKELAHLLTLDIPAPQVKFPAAVSSIKVQPPRFSTAMKLSQAFEVWKNKQNPSEMTIQEWKRSIRLFTEMHTDLPVDLIEDMQIVEFSDALKIVPKRLEKEYDKVPFPKLIKLAKEGKFKDKEPRSIASINKYISAISSVLKVMCQNAVIARNPASNKHLPDKDDESGKRLPFTIDALQTLFSSTVYSTNFWGSPETDKPSRFWIPLLGVFTGARIEEIAQLRLADIQSHNDICYISINKEDGKKLKTKSSKRNIPVHNELIRIGFIKYVEECKKKGDKYLFADLADRKDGKRGRNASNWFRRCINGLGIKNPQLCFHSLRHNFRDACENSGVIEMYSKRLMGHASQGTHGGYGTGSYIETLQEEGIKKIRYAGLDLSHLYVIGVCGKASAIKQPEGKKKRLRLIKKG